MLIRHMNLKPSYLVALSTSVKGGVSYQRVDLDAKPPSEDQETPTEDVARWETTRVIENKEEFERAAKVRGKARSLITSACIHSAFGLLCTLGKVEDLDVAYKEARKLVDEHNETAMTTHVSINMIKGKIADSDVEAAQAIGTEVRNLLDAMKDGLAKADPKAIRKAADDAKALGQMLDVGVQEKVGKAIEEARSAARAIVKRIEVGGEDAALVIQELSRKALDEARFAFLDLDDEPVQVKSTLPKGKQLDLEVM